MEMTIRASSAAGYRGGRFIFSVIDHNGKKHIFPAPLEFMRLDGIEQGGRISINGEAERVALALSVQDLDPAPLAIRIERGGSAPRVLVGDEISQPITLERYESITIERVPAPAAAGGSGEGKQHHGGGAGTGGGAAIGDGGGGASRPL